MNLRGYTAPVNAGNIREFDSDDDWSYAHGETFVRRVLVSPRILQWLAGHPRYFDHPPQEPLFHDPSYLMADFSGGSSFDVPLALEAAMENPLMENFLMENPLLGIPSMENTLTVQPQQMTFHDDLTELLNLLPGTSASDFPPAPIIQPCYQPTPSPRLPHPLISLIADFLAGASAYGTLANLNVSCWAVHRQTLQPLYEITVWDSCGVLLQRTVEGSPAGCRLPPGWAYTKYLIVDEDDARYLNSLVIDPGNRTWQSLFPHLILYVEKNRLLLVRGKEGGLSLAKTQRRTFDVQVFRPVSVRMYDFILKGLPIRWETHVRSVMVVQRVEHVRRILFHPRGRIIWDPKVPRGIYYRQEDAGCLTVTLSPAMTADVGTRQTLQSILQNLTSDDRMPVERRVVPRKSSCELRVLQCSLEVYILLIDLFSELIPASYGYPLCITISLHSPIFTSFIDAEIALGRAVKLYLDLWPTLHRNRRMGDVDTPLFELHGPAFRDLGVERALILPTGKDEWGTRFVVDVRTAAEVSVERYPIYMPPDVAPRSSYGV